jgi:hypothetical protein
MTTSLILIGPVFGYQDHFHGLAIIMDTYSNHNGPHNVSIDFFFFHKYSSKLKMSLACSSVYFGYGQ